MAASGRIIRTGWRITEHARQTYAAYAELKIVRMRGADRRATGYIHVVPPLTAQEDAVILMYIELSRMVPLKVSFLCRLRESPPSAPACSFGIHL